jgi:hypothetical protein
MGSIQAQILNNLRIQVEKIPIFQARVDSPDLHDTPEPQNEGAFMYIVGRVTT